MVHDTVRSNPPVALQLPNESWSRAMRTMCTRRVFWCLRTPLAYEELREGQGRTHIQVFQPVLGVSFQGTSATSLLPCMGLSLEARDIYNHTYEKYSHANGIKIPFPRDWKMAKKTFFRAFCGTHLEIALAECKVLPGLALGSYPQGHR